MVRVLNKRHLDLTTPISPQLHRAWRRTSGIQRTCRRGPSCPQAWRAWAASPTSSNDGLLARVAKERHQGNPPGDGYGSHHARGPWYSTRTMNRYCFHLLQGGNVGPSAAA
jgi:hypothetical protein